MAKKGGLGRGLDILFQDTGAGGGDEGVSTLRLAEIEPDKNQPRKAFDDTALSELAASITEHGVLQPIVVRPSPAGGYIIVAGERRWRAARLSAGSAAAHRPGASGRVSGAIATTPCRRTLPALVAHLSGLGIRRRA